MVRRAGYGKDDCLRAYSRGSTTSSEPQSSQMPRTATRSYARAAFRSAFQVIRSEPCIRVAHLAKCLTYPMVFSNMGASLKGD